MLTVADGVDKLIADVQCQCGVVGHRVDVVLVWFTRHVHQFIDVHLISHADLLQCRS